MNAATEMSPFNFTDSAANKVKALIEEEGNPELKLRVFCHWRRLFRLSVWFHLR